MISDSIDAIRGLYTSGVGTGKSFVFMGVAEKLMNEMTKILYVFPRYTVKENLEEYAGLQGLLRAGTP